MRDLRLQCKFGSKCLHLQEPGCAIRPAVENGVIAQSRFDSYISMWKEKTTASDGISLNKRKIRYQAKGSKTSGGDQILLHKAIDLTNEKPWGKNGYTVGQLFSDQVFDRFEGETKKILLFLWEKIRAVNSA